jgi:hypothetical protein
MKLDYAVHSSDSNPFYLDFWPLVSKIWKLKFKVEPILLYIDENHDIRIDETYGRVIKMKPVPDVPVYIQCLWIRYWWPSQVPEKVCILSDIDMFPISKRYFIEQIKNISDDKYLHLNPIGNAVFPSCYHVAKGKYYKEVFELHDSWEDSVRFINSLESGISHSIQNGTVMQKWGVDEKYATDQIYKSPNKALFLLLPRNQLRIDRTFWNWKPIHIKQDYYADSHSIRPYNHPTYKPMIDRLVEEILKGS